MVRTCRKPGVQVDLFDGEPPASRPAWRVIEAARMRHLTGELGLPSNPPTNVYLINGEVYFAERTTDGGIGVRLLVEGVITRKQMSKGSVMVSGAEHLGRLFERDESIDRHAVELCVELMTDDVLTSVSKEMVDGYTMTLYKRHPSGIDRWLPNQSTADAPAVNEDQRAAALADFPATTNGAIVAKPVVPQPVVPQPVVALPVVPQPVVPQPVVAQPTVLQPAAALQSVVAQPVVPQPVLQQPAVQQPSFADMVREPVTQPVQDDAATAVIRAAEPVARTPERLELGAWPTESPTQAPTPPPVRVATPAAAAESMPSNIADEVADAVRRALAAIDSVLVPADDEDAQSPPRPL
jgi:hypothetical protein